MPDLICHNFCFPEKTSPAPKADTKGYFEPNVLYETSEKWDRTKPTQINIQSSCAILVVKNLTLCKILLKSVHN